MRQDARETLIKVFTKRYVGKTIVDVKFDVDTQEFYAVLDDGTEIEI